MLACLEKRNAELDKIEQEYHTFDFNAFGVTNTFMMMARPSILQAEIFSRVANNQDVNVERIRLLETQCQDIYFPSKADVIMHLDLVGKFIRRTQKVHDAFEMDVPFNAAFIVKIHAEQADMMTKMPIVPISVPQYPMYLPSTASPAPASASVLEVKAPAPQKEASDEEGVSFFKNKGCLLKKK